MSTESLHQQTREVILKNIEKKDRRFRLFQGAFVVLIFLALIGLLWVQEATLNNVKKEITQQQDTIAQVKKSSDTTNRHLDCIIVYFGQKDRASLTIQDINKCTLENSTGVQQFFNTPSTSGGSTGATKSGSVDGTSSLSPQSTAPAMSLQQSSPSPTPQPNSNGGGSSTSITVQTDPLKVLGLPICVSLTGKCQ